MRLIIAEKPAVTPAFKQILNGDDNVDIIYTMAYGLFSPEYPKITFNDIPATPPYNENALRHPIVPDRDVSWCSSWVKHSGSVADMLAYIEQKKSTYTEIIVSTDNDRVGHYSAEQLLNRLDLDSQIPVTYLTLTSYHPDALAEAMLNRAPGTAMRKTYAAQQGIKRTLDFWWRINAQLVFGEACTKAGLVAHPPVSKYELMMYYFFADQSSPISQGVALNYMDRPTSRKPYPHLIGRNRPTIGSPGTMCTILNTMIKRGGIAEVSEQTAERNAQYALTPAARKFLSYLHPKTRDKDLPFRVLTWMNVPLSEVPEAREKVRRYINQIFGRQLRFQRKCFQPNPANDKP